MSKLTVMQPAALARESARLTAPFVCWAGVAAAAWELLGGHAAKLASFGFAWSYIGIWHYRRRNRPAGPDHRPHDPAELGNLVTFLGVTFLALPPLGVILFAATGSAWSLASRVAVLAAFVLVSIAAALWAVCLEAAAEGAQGSGAESRTAPV